jgi:hypothetical protein
MQNQKNSFRPLMGTPIWPVTIYLPVPSAAQSALESSLGRVAGSRQQVVVVRVHLIGHLPPIILIQVDRIVLPLLFLS